MTSPNGDSSERQGFRFDLRSLFVITALLGLFLAPVAYLEHRYWARQRIRNAILERIRSLENRRPANMTPQQWESAVGWCLNLHANSLGWQKDDVRKLQQFEARFDEKLAGTVDMTTIHWIWDEYSRLGDNGASYQRFKPQMMEEIEQK